jgi:hypothetical protein
MPIQCKENPTGLVVAGTVRMDTHAYIVITHISIGTHTTGYMIIIRERNILSIYLSICLSMALQPLRILVSFSVSQCIHSR